MSTAMAIPTLASGLAGASVTSWPAAAEAAWTCPSAGP